MDITMKSFWDKMAKSYDASTEKHFNDANSRIINYTKGYCKKSDNLLDLGCGTGMIIIDLADYVNKITAVDSSSEMIKAAREKTINKNITNINFEIDNIPEFGFIKEKYNIITAFNLLLYLTAPEIVLKKIYDCLPSGGYFISVTDCMGEKTILKGIMKFISGLGLIPKMNYFTMITLENIIKSTGFQIVFSENVHDGIPNHYIVARK